MRTYLKNLTGTVLLLLWIVINANAQSTYTVTNTNDAGAGSLRQAIINANSNADLSNINFNISGTGPFTITINTSLPDIVTRTSVKGFTQTGASVTNYLIKLTQSASPGNLLGFKFYSGSASSTLEGIEIIDMALPVDISSSASTTIKNNLINSNTQCDGISILNSNNVVITGNKIGVDVTGMSPVGNIDNSIIVRNSTGTVIGGSTAALKNHLCTRYGIQLINTSSCSIKGNLIGVNASEAVFSTRITGYGIYLNSGSGSNTIGGPGLEGNIIGGTKLPSQGLAGTAIIISGSTSNNNIIKGNRIGINSSNTIISNYDGIVITDNSQGNTIGSTISTEANIISGNSAVGIRIQTGASSTTIIGNKIGTNSAGTAAAANGDGITISSGVNQIGGTTTSERNIISGNTNTGLSISSNGNTIRNNFIGTNASGTSAIPNTNGIIIAGNSTNNNIIGGSTSYSNLLSGNTQFGLWVAGSYNTVKGNKIGTDITGKLAIPNNRSGIILGGGGGNNQIGGSTAADVNIISGNTTTGIEISNSVSNIILGNKIGTDVDGILALSNTTGISIIGGSTLNSNSNVIGGANTNEGNLISGNSSHGIVILDYSSNTTVKGNKIGTDINGSSRLPNGLGIIINSLTGNNTIIGGSLTGESNIISGNNGDGIYLGPCQGTIVQGNYIGTNASLANLYNQGHGIYISSAKLNQIGGISNSNERNLIINNNLGGILVASNGIGTNGNRNSILSNLFYNNGTGTSKAIDLFSIGNSNKVAPTITSYSVSGSNFIINGTTSASGDRIQLYLGNSTYQNANLYLSGYDVITTGTSWTTTIPYSVVSPYIGSTYPKIMATATDVNNNTSEFGNCMAVVVMSSIPSQYCLNAAPITLSATPAGGTFTGTGVSGNTFTPSTAGANVITYTVTYSGCSSGQDQKTINVEDYTNISLTPSCSYEPSVRRRWVIDHPTHLNPISMDYSITNPRDATVRTGTITTSATGTTYFESQTSGIGFVALINFANTGDAVPSQSQQNDFGLLYPQGTGFGWTSTPSSVNTSVVSLWDNRYTKSRPLTTGNTWKIDVPRAGTYEVRLVCGIQGSGQNVQTSNIVVSTQNGADPTLTFTDPDFNDDWDEYIGNITVSGTSGFQLRVNAGPSAINASLAYIEVKEVVPQNITLKACNNTIKTLSSAIASRCLMSGSDRICEASSGSNYTVQTPTPAINGSTYTWQINVPGGPGTASISGTTATGTVNTLTQTGPVFVTLTEQNPNFWGSGSSIVKYVYIQPVGLANFTQPSGCLSTSPTPNQKTFSSTSASPTPYSQAYRWYVDGGSPLSTNSAYTHTFSNTGGPTTLYGIHTITLETAVRNRLCTSTKTLSYVAVPQPTMGFTGGDNGVCDGTVLHYVNASVGLVGPTPTTDPPMTFDGVYQLTWSTVAGQVHTEAVDVLYSNNTATNTNVGFGFTINNSATCGTGNGGPITIYGKVQLAKTIQNVSCPNAINGSINFTLSGGTPTYNYEITSTPSGSIVASGICSTNAVLVNALPMGDYNMKVIDKWNGIVSEQCTSNFPFTIGVDGASVSICTQNRNCNTTGGNILVTTSTPIGSTYQGDKYNYVLTNKATLQTITGTNIPINLGLNASNGPNVLTLTGITDGIYTLKVTPNSGAVCVYNFDIQMGPPVLKAGLSYSNICDGSGLTAPVSFSPSVYQGSCSAQPISPSYSVVVRRASDNVVMSPSSPMSYNLLPGAYTYTLSEANLGCTPITGQFSIAHGAPFTVAVSNIKNATCLNTNNGSATALVLGGGSNISYSWIDNSTSVALNVFGAQAKNIPVGTYKVTVTDNTTGCQVTSSVFSIANGNPIEIDDVTGNGCSSTAIMLSGSTGVKPLKYKWSRQLGGGLTDTRYVSPAEMNDSHIASNIVAGTYEVTVTDANGCTSAPYPFIQQKTVREYNICMRYINKPRTKVKPPEIVEPPIPTALETEVMDLARAIEEKVQKCVDKAENDAYVSIENTCEDPAKLADKVTLTYTLKQYQYTLYKYNRGNDLVGTVPPNGVAELLLNGTIPVNRDGATASTLTEYQDYLTSYRFNTLKQSIYQKTPDAGSSEFYYNNKGQLRFSRNAKQIASASPGVYNYTKYDALGRVTETGESSDWNSTNANLSTNLNNFSSYPTTGTERTLTYYSQTSLINYTFTGSGGKPQRNQRNRVSRMERENVPVTGSSVTTKIHYSYDPQGNIEWLRQDIPSLYNSFIAYEYDLISNKVIKVKYNEGFIDRLFHKYCYDNDNRIIEVFTSKDSIIWDKDVKYDYYVHGPLKRTELGQDKIQGLDYTYTLQGWLKGINTPNLSTSLDPGEDNGSTTATDVFGMGLTYYNGDFYNNTTNAFNSSGSTNTLKLNPIQERFNGNITSWSLQAGIPGVSGTGLMGNRYQYDRLNRLLNSEYLEYNIGTQTWSVQNGSDYNTSYSYDPNGNLKTLNRNATLTSGSNNMDALTYNYYNGIHSNSAVNQLKNLTDAVTHSQSWGDITSAANSNGNGTQYIYDHIGNLITDKRSQVKVTWDIYGKVKQVDPTDANGNIITPTASTPQLTFLYDPLGNRIAKGRVIPIIGQSSTEYYYRDVSGNMMEIIRFQPIPAYPGALVTTTEIGLYGNERLGLYRPIPADIPFNWAVPSSRIAAGSDETIITRKIGLKQYELTDHLGNLCATVSDKLTRTVGLNSLRADISYYTAYYPYGMGMPGKTFTSITSRYGFNGKEKDIEGFGGSGSTYDYGFRIYNPQIGRFLSIDPLTRDYPYYTPYQFGGNDPIYNLDLDGLEDWGYLDKWINKGTNYIKNKTSEYVTKKVDKVITNAYESTKKYVAQKANEVTNVIKNTKIETTTKIKVGLIAGAEGKIAGREVGAKANIAAVTLLGTTTNLTDPKVQPILHYPGKNGATEISQELSGGVGIFSAGVSREFQGQRIGTRDDITTFGAEIGIPKTEMNYGYTGELDANTGEIKTSDNKSVTAFGFDAALFVGFEFDITITYDPNQNSNQPISTATDTKPEIK